MEILVQIHKRQHLWLVYDFYTCLVHGAANGALNRNLVLTRKLWGLAERNVKKTTKASVRTVGPRNEIRSWDCRIWSRSANLWTVTFVDITCFNMAHTVVYKQELAVNQTSHKLIFKYYRTAHRLRHARPFITQITIQSENHVRSTYVH